MPRKKHIHKYHKVSFVGGARSVWACGLPACNHYMPEHMSHLVPGKMSICFSCSKEFQLTEDSLERDEPICISCSLKERGIDITNGGIDELIAAISAKVKSEEKAEKDKEENK